MSALHGMRQQHGTLQRSVAAGGRAPAARPCPALSARRITRSSQHLLQRRTPTPAPCRVATPVEVHTTTPDTPPAAASVPEPVQPPQFSWTKAWYPIAAVEHLDPEKPNKITLLGKDYVLWADAQGSWQVMEDRCPHRLATLSDGIVHRESGEIVCAYHGWRFAADGTCTSIPQATSSGAEANACSNRRSCVTSFPAEVRGGLLWAWPDTSPARWVEAAAAEVPLVPEMEGEGLVPLAGRWFVRDLPYGWDFFAENVLDPAHVDFAHHGIAGFDAGAFKKFELVPVEDQGPNGFTFASRPLDATRRGALHIFRPPSLITIRPGPDPEGADAAGSTKDGDVRPGSNNPNVLTTLLFYIVPTKPGWSRLHGCSWTTDRAGQPLKTLSLFTNAMPTWVRHVLSYNFFAGDDVFLGAATRAYAKEGSNWRRSYYMPTSTDAAIVALRRWLEKYAGGAIPWPAHLQGESHVLSNLDLTRPQAMDYYTQHVQHCTHCKAALAGTRTWAARATAAAFAAFLAAGLVAAVRAQVAAGAVTGLPGWALAALGSGPLGAVAPLVVVGLLAVGVVAVARKLEGQFFYRDWQRPAF